MKYLKRFNENYRALSDDEIQAEIDRVNEIKDHILDIFQPLEDKSSSEVVSVTSGTAFGHQRAYNHIAIDVVSKDTYNGFGDEEKIELKYILTQFENWCNEDGNILSNENGDKFEILDDSYEDCSYFELVEAETKCPECGHYEIDSSGYDYDTGRSFSECTRKNCGYTGDDEEFEDKYTNFYDFEKLNEILFETNPTRIKHMIYFNIVIKV
jgi:hypothetical protein